VVLHDVKHICSIQQKEYWAQYAALWNATENARDRRLIIVDEDYLGPAGNERTDPGKDGTADTE